MNTRYLTYQEYMAEHNATKAQQLFHDYHLCRALNNGCQYVVDYAFSSSDKFAGAEEFMHRVFDQLNAHEINYRHVFYGLNGLTFFLFSDTDLALYKLAVP